MNNEIKSALLEQVSEIADNAIISEQDRRGIETGDAEPLAVLAYDEAIENAVDAIASAIEMILEAQAHFQGL